MAFQVMDADQWSVQCERQAAGYEESNFFIDDLEAILYPLVSLN